MIGVHTEEVQTIKIDFLTPFAVNLQISVIFCHLASSGKHCW